MQGSRAGDTGSESGPTYSDPGTGRSQVQGSQQPPCAPPSLGHIVLTELGPPISAEGDPHSYTALSNLQGPCGYHIPQDPVDAD